MNPVIMLEEVSIISKYHIEAITIPEGDTFAQPEIICNDITCKLLNSR